MRSGRCSGAAPRQKAMMKVNRRYRTVAELSLRSADVSSGVAAAVPAAGAARDRRDGGRYTMLAGLRASASLAP